jgi:hypothetical protein
MIFLNFDRKRFFVEGGATELNKNYKKFKQNIF